MYSIGAIVVSIVYIVIQDSYLELRRLSSDLMPFHEHSPRSDVVYMHISYTLV